ncbi:polysaccharide biosynthesis/export family protein [Alloyangia pacifica]|uniref:polysaccharide biosynthesis/export family protein n=1 Tax=Alloyangia pacifica TaxID=311180 RepID=UPI001CD732FF|nr:polysaccharide biosynthesis/export family protein [Alloyangia pacifica]MCA0994796.1 polysaccharide biosynthesis/export family protein [Alloyangia pacifica]
MFALLVTANAAFSDPYRLVPGDSLRLWSSAAGEYEDLRVDIDGQVRVSGVGGISVGNLTLDEAEERVEDETRFAALYVDPKVSLKIIDYAPIIVVGDVANPGALAYLPGMTVASALAMSGGSQAEGISRLEVERARTDIESQAKVVNFEIATTAIRIARLEASLAGESVFDLPDRLTKLIPNPRAVPLEKLMEAEREILKTDAQRASDLLGFWADEIATIEEKRRLFGERIALQESIVESAQTEMDTAEQLQERGLQTASRMTAVEQRLSTAQAGALELESARIAATQALADARRAQAQFLAARREEDLAALQQARIDIDTQTLRYARALEQLSLLSEGQVAALLMEDPFTVKVEVHSTREDRGLPQEIDPLTRILPGDTLYVSVETSTDVPMRN